MTRTGRDVAELRRSLDLTPPELADLLGVSHSTVYRWEQVKDRVVRIDPLQDRVLSLIERAQRERSDVNYGRAIGDAIMESGGLYALYRVLASVYDKR